MTKTYTAANGQKFTDADIDRWCSAYETGQFPAGEQTVGQVVHGRPPLSAGEETVVISVKVPAHMKRAIESKAESAGVSSSAYIRNVLAAAL